MNGKPWSLERLVVTAAALEKLPETNIRLTAQAKVKQAIDLVLGSKSDAIVEMSDAEAALSTIAIGIYDGNFHP